MSERVRGARVELTAGGARARGGEGLERRRRVRGREREGPRRGLVHWKSRNESETKNGKCNFDSTSLAFTQRTEGMAFPIPIPGSPLSPYSTSPRSPATRAVRRVSVGQHSPSSLPFGSFVGSFETSILAGRLSAQPSHPVHFLASIGVLGEASDNKLRCPPHLHLPFPAFFYPSAESSLHERGSPYVGTIDLESHYFQSLSTPSPPSDTPSPPTAQPETAPPPIPKFPGYRIPKKGSLQVVVKYPESSAGAVKLFLCKYDLTGLDCEGRGGKTFVRQKSYSVESGGGNRLRYAIHLQFCSPPTPSPPADLPGFRTSSPASPARAVPRYYLHKSIRVVFASSAINSSEKLVVVSEGPAGIDGGTQEGFAPYLGPGENWEMLRQKAKLRNQGMRTGVSVPRASIPPSTRNAQVDIVIPPAPLSPPSLATLSLSSFSYSPLSSTTLHRSPHSPTPRHPPTSALSGLSTSRPASRAANTTTLDDPDRAMDSERIPGEESEEGRQARLIGR